MLSNTLEKAVRRREMERVDEAEGRAAEERLPARPAFEAGRRVPIAATLAAVKVALDKQGAEFLESEGARGIRFPQ